MKKKGGTPDVIRRNCKGIKRKLKKGERILLVHLSSNIDQYSQSGCGHGQCTVCSSAPDSSFSSAGV